MDGRRFKKPLLQLTRANPQERRRLFVRIVVVGKENKISYTIYINYLDWSSTDAEFARSRYARQEVAHFCRLVCYCCSSSVANAESCFCVPGMVNDDDDSKALLHRYMNCI